MAKPKYSPETKLAVVNHYLSGKDGEQGLTALSAEFTIGEGELMAHDVPLGCAPDEYDDLISGTCSHLP